MPDVLETDFVHSFLDQDLYKITMGQAIMMLFPKAHAIYRFKNRGRQRFTKAFIDDLSRIVREQFPKCILTNNEAEWMKLNIPFIQPWYVDYLKSFRFNPKQVLHLSLNEADDLEISIGGPWHETVYWEVHLMKVISELYFQKYSNWNGDCSEYAAKTAQKAQQLNGLGGRFIDFGTRRRRSYNCHLAVFDGILGFGQNYQNFSGTSNVHLAMRFNAKAQGTFAHEWVQGNSVLEGLRYSNRFSMQNWMKVYHGKLGIALSDTFGSDAFFRDFDDVLARQYDGIRQDSGDPIKFAEKVIEHYKALNIDPASKIIVFSDALDVVKCTKIANFCKGKIKYTFGIGTNLTNDFGPESLPLNMVIKLNAINNIPVVKLSDDPGKETGDKDAVRVARWTFTGKGLD